jgi:UDP-N-acetylmuramoyl-L-alanyl-D-glutamate--2,6-diaminopimelate ligase
MKKIIKKFSPYFIFDIYYYVLAILGAFIYSFPSNKMVVIGVVGTKGKTSTVNFIWSTLMAGGIKTGIISTANIRIGNDESLNKYHMTMPGRLTIQSLMSKMVKSGCRYCIVETTSEGIKQHRHIGINYDILVFTNITPEHLQSHENSFDKYKEAKAKVFKDLSKGHKKIIDGKAIEKTIIVNNDAKYADYFLNFNADKKITFGINNIADYKVTNVINDQNGVNFNVNNKETYSLQILGLFNIYNALPAIIVSELAFIDNSNIKKGLKDLRVIPGRMEIINLNQNFTVIVDYAHEKESITNILQTANTIRKEGSKVIIIIGAEGGGRDKAKRPIMGELSAKMADYVIVTNVDPYDDDPVEILEDIATSSEKFGKIREKNLFVIEDRREGIKKALSLAKKDDIVLITSKGAEQSMIIKGKSLPWDDRKVVKEELTTLLQSQ